MDAKEFLNKIEKLMPATRTLIENYVDSVSPTNPDPDIIKKQNMLSDTLRSQGIATDWASPLSNIGVFIAEHKHLRGDIYQACKNDPEYREQFRKVIELIGLVAINRQLQHQGDSIGRELRSWQSVELKSMDTVPSFREIQASVISREKKALQQERADRAAFFAQTISAAEAASLITKKILQSVAYRK